MMMQNNSNQYKKVLNIGAGSKQIKMPRHYDGWNKIYLDANQNPEMDIIADARDMKKEIPDNSFDAVFTSHVLEHFFLSDVSIVLKEFHRILKPNGLIETHVPDFYTSVKKVINEDYPIDKPLYQSPAGPICTLDIIYGYSKFVKQGTHLDAHKTAFTPEFIRRLHQEAGFKVELIECVAFEIVVAGNKI